MCTHVVVASLEMRDNVDAFLIPLLCFDRKQVKPLNAFVLCKQTWQDSDSMFPCDVPSDATRLVLR